MKVAVLKWQRRCFVLMFAPSVPSFIVSSGDNAENDDFTLIDDSPCVDSGQRSDQVGSTDLAGNSRIVGDNIDMGAYEVQ